jgi:hypothetical protein
MAPSRTRIRCCSKASIDALIRLISAIESIVLVEEVGPS